jgi:hypothetical protein
MFNDALNWHDWYCERSEYEAAVLPFYRDVRQHKAFRVGHKLYTVRVVLWRSEGSLE